MHLPWMEAPKLAWVWNLDDDAVWAAGGVGGEADLWVVGEDGAAAGGFAAEIVAVGQAGRAGGLEDLVVEGALERLGRDADLDGAGEGGWARRVAVRRSRRRAAIEKDSPRRCDDKAMAKAARIEALDGVRTLAIGAVFLHHAFGLKMLWAGVDLFFVLSGFLITGILIGAKGRGLGSYFGHFYERRARRILPPYLVMLALTSVVVGVGWMRQGYLYLFLMNFIVALQMPHPAAV